MPRQLEMSEAEEEKEEEEEGEEEEEEERDEGIDSGGWKRAVKRVENVTQNTRSDCLRYLGNLNYYYAIHLHTRVHFNSTLDR